MDRRRPLTSILSVLLNGFCFVATVDFVHRAHVFYDSQSLSFSRIGYVNHESAQIVIRAPEASIVALFLRAEDDEGWQVLNNTVSVSGDTDFVGTFKINGLRVNTIYAYETNATHARTCNYHFPCCHRGKGKARHRILDIGSKPVLRTFLTVPQAN